MSILSSLTRKATIRSYNNVNHLEIRYYVDFAKITKEISKNAAIVFTRVKVLTGEFVSTIRTGAQSPGGLNKTLRDMIKEATTKAHGLMKKNRIFTRNLGANTPTLFSDGTDKSSTGDRTSRSELPAIRRPVEKLDLSFENSNKAFMSKTNWELIRAIIVYEICSTNAIIRNSKHIQEVIKKVFGNRIFILVMKLTFYGHFVAGEDEFKIKPILIRMMAFGVKPILDYSVEEDITEEKAKALEKKAYTSEGDHFKHERQFQFSEKTADRRYLAATRAFFYVNEASCERNMENFLRCLEALGRDTNGVGITAVKLTALGRPSLLLQLSEVIMRTRKYMNEILGTSGNIINHHIKKSDLEKRIAQANISDRKSVEKFVADIETDSEGIVHLFPWTGIVTKNYQLNTTFRIPDLKTGKMIRMTSMLSDKEEEMFRNMIRRLNTVVKAAEIIGAKVMIDAEQTYVQPAITRLAIEFMRQYNKKKLIVLNTYQTYLKAALEEVKSDLEQARRQDFCFGAKVVRGAYIAQERLRASTLNYADPTNPSFEATTNMMNATLDAIMEEYLKYKAEGREDRIHLMVASHNEDTIRYTIKKMNDMNIKPSDSAVSFGQLLGMCDHVTFPLGLAGYAAYKYVPYGPVLYVLPYLTRRAEENTGFMKVNKEKTMLYKELGRRFKAGRIIYNPTPPG